MNVFERARLMAIKGKSGTSLDKTLVVIDMQECFVNSNERYLVSRVVSLIGHAKRNNWAVIIVYLDEDDTVEEIRSAVHNYPHHIFAPKYGCSGSKQIIECLNSEPKWSNNLLVCGVYGNQCVEATVSELLMNSSVKVSVIMDAVEPECVPRESGAQMVMASHIGCQFPEGELK